jgi:hypothetical protein
LLFQHLSFSGSGRFLPLQNNQYEFYIYIKLFLESTAAGFEYYRIDLGIKLLKNTEPAVDMVRILNAAFDVMNGRHRDEFISKEN